MDQQPKRRSRSRRAVDDRPRAIYQARVFDETQDQGVSTDDNHAPASQESTWQATPFSSTASPLAPSWDDDAYRGYTKNEAYQQREAPVMSPDGYRSNEEQPVLSYTATTTQDLSAYAAYRSNDEVDEGEAVEEPLYAEPVKLSIPSYLASDTQTPKETYAPPVDDFENYAPPAQISAYDPLMQSSAEEVDVQYDQPYAWDQVPQVEVPQMQSHMIYTPQKTADHSQMPFASYQVEDPYEEQSAPMAKSKKGFRILWVIVPVVVLLLVVGVWFVKDTAFVQGIIGGEGETSTASVEVVQEMAGYDNAVSQTASTQAIQGIENISAGVNMTSVAVTDDNVLMRNQASDGTYEFYLFTATEGKLLAYFDGLDASGMSPMQEGGFYVKQAPYLVGTDGSSLIDNSTIEASLGQGVILDAMYQGWAIVRSEDGAMVNYVNASGELINTLWFCEAYPFIADQTIAFVDTGSDSETGRYLLYQLDVDGTVTRLEIDLQPQDVAGSYCGMVYLENGELYALKDWETPVITSSEVIFYPDCNTVVAKDAQTGKYGLFVDGEQHYDFVYDDISPVASDLTWQTQTVGNMKISVVSGATYPQPLAHYFSLMKDGEEQYVALSTDSSCPIVLGE